jgi:ubiquinone/menaquinone biosynthesis C-methylase UbiE
VSPLWELEVMSDGVQAQRERASRVFGDPTEGLWDFHYTSDPLVRYLRDRRLHRALRELDKRGKLDVASQSVLLVCGGVGGEGTFLANQGFVDVTVSDLSDKAMELCRRFDGRLKTRVLNAEDMSEVEDGSYDLVLVQDGLHHLPRPVLGFTEMLRVARTAVVVIEPHSGLVARAIGTQWEVDGDAINYVFRWSRSIFEQATRSYLLREDAEVITCRFFDHNLVVNRAVSKLPLPRRTQLLAARSVYGLLHFAAPMGNMMVGIVVKPSGPSPQRLVAH